MNIFPFMVMMVTEGGGSEARIMWYFQIWVLILAFPIAHRMALSKLFKLCLSFLIYKARKWD